MRKFRLTYFFFLLLIVLAAYVIFVDEAPPPDGVKPTIYKIPGADVERIEVSRDGTIIVFARAAGEDRWLIESHKGVHADSGGISSMLAAFEDLTVERELLGAGENLAEYGLANPAMSITFQDKKQVRHTLLIGEKNPAGDHYYVKTPNQGGVFLYAGGNVEKFRRELTDYRSRILGNLKSQDVQRLEYRQGKLEVILIREGLGWKLKGDDNFRVSHAVAGQIINRLSGLAVKSFVSDEVGEQAKYGLVNPSAQAWLYTDVAGETDPFHLRMGKKDDAENSYYVAVSGQPSTYLVKPGSLENIFKSRKELRDKKAFSFYAKDIQEMKLSLAGQDVRCQRRENEWDIIEPMSLTGAGLAATALANEVVSLAFEEFISDKPSEKELKKYGLNVSVCTLDIITNQGDQRLIFGKQKGSDMIYGRPADQGIGLYSLDLFNACRELADLAAAAEAK